MRERTATPPRINQRAFVHTYLKILLTWLGFGVLPCLGLAYFGFEFRIYFFELAGVFALLVLGIFFQVRFFSLYEARLTQIYPQLDESMRKHRFTRLRILLLASLAIPVLQLFMIAFLSLKKHQPRARTPLVFRRPLTFASVLLAISILLPLAHVASKAKYGITLPYRPSRRLVSWFSTPTVATIFNVFSDVQKIIGDVQDYNDNLFVKNGTHDDVEGIIASVDGDAEIKNAAIVGIPLIAKGIEGAHRRVEERRRSIASEERANVHLEIIEDYVSLLEDRTHDKFPMVNFNKVSFLSPTNVFEVVLTTTVGLETSRKTRAHFTAKLMQELEDLGREIAIKPLTEKQLARLHVIQQKIVALHS